MGGGGSGREGGWDGIKGREGWCGGAKSGPCNRPRKAGKRWREESRPKAASTAVSEVSRIDDRSACYAASRLLLGPVGNRVVAKGKAIFVESIKGERADGCK